MRTRPIRFRGTVSQVRLAPTTVQNVVTYTAVIDVANPDLKLKPGMTANVTVSVAESDNVLAVPNAALRFRPRYRAGRRGRDERRTGAVEGRERRADSRSTCRPASPMESAPRSSRAT